MKERGTCETCRFFDNETIRVATAHYDGTCRKKSASLYNVKTNEIIALVTFPPVNLANWCGEWDHKNNVLRKGY